jgi:hypothetical protein
MLTVTYAECHIKAPYANCRYAECRGTNKLECLLLAGLSSLVLCLWVRPGAFPKGEHLKGHTHKHWKRLDRPARGRNSSLFCPFVRY